MIIIALKTNPSRYIFMLLLLSYKLLNHIAKSEEEFLLNKKTFELASSITKIESKSLPDVIHLYEYYSYDQKRARLQYDILNSNKLKKEEFFFDLKTGNSLYYSDLRHNCLEGDLIKLQKYFYDDGSNKGQLMYQFLDSIDVTGDYKHIIGPAKLLFLIESKSNFLMETSTPIDTENNSNNNNNDFIYVRNHPVIEYELILPLNGEDSKVRMMIYYSKSSHNSTLFTKTSIPFQVLISFPKDGYAVIIDFFTYNILPLPTTTITTKQANVLQESGVNSQHDSFDSICLGSKPDTVIVDRFAFPISFNCSSLFEGRLKQVKLFDFYELTTTRFSFNVITEDFYNYKSETYFVAYDGMSKSMRLDRFKLSTSSYPNDNENSRSYINIMDFKSNRKYILIKDKKDNQINNNNNKIQDRLSKCAVTYLMKPLSNNNDGIKEEINETEFEKQLTISKLIVGSKGDFYLMGKAKVNGIICNIYEAYTNELPFWFKTPSVIRKNEQVEMSNKNKFNIVVYASEASNNLDDIESIKILQIEYYDLQLSRESTFRRSLLAKFHNFIWDLTDSPNGDKNDQLFSISDTCALREEFSSPLDSNFDLKANPDKYIKINLLLESEDNSRSDYNNDLKQFADNNKFSKQNFNWLENPNSRNKALISSFTETMGLQNSMIYDLNSRLIKRKSTQGEEKSSVIVEFKVAEHPQLIHTIDLISTKVLLKNLKQTKHHFSIIANSISDCLSLTGLSKNLFKFKPFFVYRYERVNKCFVDLELINYVDNNDKLDFIEELNQVNFNSLSKRSQVFQFANSTTGAEFYRINTELDSHIQSTNSWLKEGRYKRFENKILILMNLLPSDLGSPVDPNILRLRIKKIKLINNNVMNSFSNDNSVVVASSFPGFKLPPPPPIDDNNNQNSIEKEATLNSQSVVINRIVAGDKSDQINDDSSSSSSSSLLGTMTLLQCEASCLEELNCRSYSYCQTSRSSKDGEPECLISNLSFKAPLVSKFLSPNNKTTKKLTIGSRVKIPFKRQQDIEVEVVKDKSCELFNKNYLNLFERYKQIRTNFKELEVIPIVSGGEESCAEICFEKTLQSIVKINLLEEDINNQLLLLSKIDNNKSEFNIDEYRRKDLEIRKKYKQYSQEFCNHFIYAANTTLSDEQYKLLNRATNNKIYITNSAPASYCAIENKSLQQDDNELIDISSISFDTYKFDYANMYEKTYGYRFKDTSPKNIDFYTIYNKLLTFDYSLKHSFPQQTEIALEESDFKTMKELLLVDKNNLQRTLRTSEKLCAEFCYTQSSTLWPACRSFDIVLKTKPNSKYEASGDTICYMNSLQLDQINDKNSDDIIESINYDANGPQVWHFEPRFGLAKKQTDAAYQLSRSVFDFESIVEGAFFNQISKATLGKSAILLIFILGLASGIFIGVELARRVLIYFDKINANRRNEYDRSLSFQSLNVLLTNNNNNNNDDTIIQ